MARSPGSILLACAIAAVPVAFASFHGIEERLVVRRDVQYGGSCGRQGNNAVCATGLCCSFEGRCGNESTSCAAPNCQFNFAASCDANRKPFGDIDTSHLDRPRFGAIEYGTQIFKCKLPGKIALTFDDGPIKPYTSELLDVLKQNDAKATFFLVGTNNGKGFIEDETAGFPAIVRRMRTDGHQVGAHSWSHQSFTEITADERHAQITKLETALADILGYFPTYMRVPYSGYNEDIRADLERFGYHNMEFDLDTFDTENGRTPQELKDKFSAALAAGDPATRSFLVVAHDLQPDTVHGLVQHMVTEAKKYKYELVTVGDCLGDHPNNWYRDYKTGHEFDGPAPKAAPKQAAGDAASGAPASSSSSPPSSSRPSAPAASASGGGASAGPTPVASKGSSGSGSASSTPSPAGTEKPSLAARNIPGSSAWMFLVSVVLLISQL